jgi:hypothetical protein
MLMEKDNLDMRIQLAIHLPKRDPKDIFVNGELRYFF